LDELRLELVLLREQLVYAMNTRQRRLHLSSIVSDNVTSSTNCTRIHSANQLDQTAKSIYVHDSAAYKILWKW